MTESTTPTSEPAISRIDELLESARSALTGDRSLAQQMASEALDLATTIGDDARRSRALLVLGSLRRSEGATTPALERFRDAVAAAEAAGSPWDIARARNSVASGLLDLGELQQAIDELNRGIEVAEDLDDRFPLGLLHNTLSIVHKNLSDPAASLRHGMIALDIFVEVGSIDGEVTVAANMGNIYLILNDRPNAEQSFRRAIEMSREHGRPMPQAAFSGLALVLNQLRRHDEALELTHRTLESIRAGSDRRHESHAIMLLANIHRDRGDREESFRRYQEAYELARSRGEPLQIELLGFLGECHLMRGDLSKGIEMLHEAIEGLMKRGNKNLAFQFHDLLSDAYEEMGDGKRALEHHRRSVEIKEEVMGAEQQNALRQMQMRIEAERAARQREELELERRRIEQEMAEKSAELVAMARRMAEQNQFLDSLRGELEAIATSTEGGTRQTLKQLTRAVNEKADTADKWRAFEEQFEQVHRGFSDALAARFPALTRTELKVCSLLKLGLSTREIADILSTTPKNAEVHRYRIRKKLAMTPSMTFEEVFGGARSGE